MAIYDKYYSGIVLISNNGDLILQLRDQNPTISNPGKISTFGGTANQHESPIECAIREIKEETNLLPKKSDLKLIWEIDLTFKSLNTYCSIYEFNNIEIKDLLIYEGESIVIINKSNIVLYLANTTTLCTLILKNQYSYLFEDL